MMKLARSASIAVFCATAPAFSEPLNLEISETVEPAFSTNAPQSEKKAESGGSIESQLSAIGRGSLSGYFDYVLIATLRNERYFEFPRQNYDYLIAGAGASKSLGSYRIGINGAGYYVFNGTFRAYHSQYYDINAFAQRRIQLSGGVVLLPGMAFSRRFSDVEGQEWLQAAPQFAIGFPAVGGTLVFSGEYEFRAFDEKDRIDQRLRFDASWTTEITEHSRFGLKAALIHRWSSKNGYFSDFTIGPVWRITLLPRR